MANRETGCPCCGARWYGYLTFCWNCKWDRGDPIVIKPDAPAEEL